MREQGTVIFYGIPAYGHIHSNIYLAERLTEEGFRVIYYSLDRFRELIKANNCEYRPYPIDEDALDLSDGNKILKLYRILLQYTQDMLPSLLIEAKREKPCLVLFDSLALWGRMVGSLLHLPFFSFYSIAAIDWPSGRGLSSYAAGFSADFLRYIGELPRALQIRRNLERRYRIKRLGLLPVMMNKCIRNFCGYSPLFQPEGKAFGSEYHFVGPLSVYRTVTEKNDFTIPSKPFLYISLGTIFNQNNELLQSVIEQFGAGNGGNESNKSHGQSGHTYQVVMVWDTSKNSCNISFPDNFIVRPFVNQSEVLQKSSLFITAGGMNSIHEALYYGVPCLLCPQQGEQLLNAKRFEKLGFGRILRNPTTLKEEAEKCILLKEIWSEKKRKQMLNTAPLETAIRYMKQTARQTEIHKRSN